jgi:hypothetical protein
VQAAPPAKKISYSAIEKYLKCSELYRRWYLDKSVPRPLDISVAMEGGTYVHGALEEYYGVYERGMHPMNIMEFMWQIELAKYELDGLYEDLQGLRFDYSSLMGRAAADYKGPNPIRNGKNEVPKKPKQTKAWEKMAAALNLENREHRVNIKAAEKNPVWKELRLSDVFSESYYLLEKFKDNFIGHTIIAIEFEFEVVLPGTDYIFRGKIDLITRDAFGRLGIYDHKTSKDAPTAGKVQHWEQLLLYAWAYWIYTQEWPSLLGINHLRSGNLVTGNFDQSLVQPAVDRKIAATRGIDAGVFIPRAPGDFGAPCVNEYDEERVCCYFKVCHPKFARALGR